MNKFKRYLPEILAICAAIGIPIGDILLSQGIKENDKRKICAAILVHCASGGLIFASGHYSHLQKASLLSMLGLSGTQLQDYKATVKEVVGEDKAKEIETKIEDADLNKLIADLEDADKKNLPFSKDKQLYYFPQFPLQARLIEIDPDVFNDAYINLNDIYQSKWEVSINDFIRMVDRKLLKHDKDLQLYFNDFGWKCQDPESGFFNVGMSQGTRCVNGIKVVCVKFTEEPKKFEEWDDYYDWLNKVVYEEEMKHNAY